MRWVGVKAEVAIGLAAAFLLATWATGCGEDEELVEETCLTNDQFFVREVWGPVMSRNCIQCHNGQGIARDSDLVLVPESQPGFIDVNMANLEQLSEIEIDGEPILLLKPLGAVEHGGGRQISEGGTEFAALAELVERFEVPVACEATTGNSHFAGVEMLEEVGTLRRAGLILVGRLPTADEEAIVLAEGDAGLRRVLDGMLQEEAFYGWLRRAYNDLFLTDRYVGGDNALNLIDGDDFPGRYWVDELAESGADPAYVELAERFTNDSLAREALDLIAHVVRNDRPFTEILTAEYRLVNPYTAPIYDITDVDFTDWTDPNEFREAILEGTPTAGVLTSPMWLNRFPTTATNRNRHRARMVYRFFLATDVLKLAERPVDPTSIEDFNPTLYNPACTVCHAVIDPVGGAFQNWDAEGRFRPPEDGWFSDMAPPGFGDTAIPHQGRLQSLPWLAGQIARDTRFAQAAVQVIYRGLTGQEALTAPSDINAPTYQADLDAFEEQRQTFERIATQFIESNYNLKEVVRELVLTPYFRAVNLSEHFERRAEQLDHLGTARLLSPEDLNRQIVAVTGYPWRGDADARDYLLDAGWYLIFYGGIDSRDVTERITEPNGLVANVAQRMANEVACRAVPQDFTLDREERLLFALVEPTFEPEDVNGFEVDRAIDAIQRNIQYLHRHVLGQDRLLSDPEVEATYQLWYDVWSDGRAGVMAEEYDPNLPWSCRARQDFWTGRDYPEEQMVERDERYTIRAWMAVMTYLLTDYHFLHE